MHSKEHNLQHVKTFLHIWARKSSSCTSTAILCPYNFTHMIHYKCMINSNLPHTQVLSYWGKGHNWRFFCPENDLLQMMSPAFAECAAEAKGFERWTNQVTNLFQTRQRAANKAVSVYTSALIKLSFYLLQLMFLIPRSTSNLKYNVWQRYVAIQFAAQRPELGKPPVTAPRIHASARYCMSSGYMCN